MNPTHERIPRLAECIQWEGSNTQAVAEFLGRHGMTGTLYRDKFLTVRENGRVIHTMWPDSWALEGEDGKIRFYTDYTFKSIYQKTANRRNSKQGVTILLFGLLCFLASWRHCVFAFRFAEQFAWQHR